MTVRTIQSAARFLVVAALATPLAVFPWVFYPFIYSKALFFETVIFLAAGLVMAAGDWKKRIPRDPLAGTLVLFVAVSVVSAAVGLDWKRSLLGYEERSLGVLFVALAVGLFFLLRITCSSRRDWMIVGRAATVFSGLSAALAIVQWLVFEAGGNNFLGIDAGGRAAGLLGNPIHLGVFIPLGLIWAARGAVREGGVWRIASAVSAVFLVVAFYLTFARGAHLAAVAGVAAAAGAAAWLTSRRKTRLAALAAIMAIMAVAAVLFIFRKTPVVTGLPMVGPIVSSSFSQDTLGTRAMAWQTGMTAFLDRPLFGWGPENFSEAFNAHYNPKFLEFSVYETWFDRTQNAAIDILATEGVMGFLAAAGVAVAAVAALLRARARRRIGRAETVIVVGAVTVYAVELLAAFDNPSSIVYLLVLLAYLAWCAWGGENAESKTCPEPSRGIQNEKIRMRLAAPALILFLAIIAVVDAAPALASSRAREMALAFKTGNPEAAALLAELLDRWTIYPDLPRVEGIKGMVQEISRPDYPADRFAADFPLVRRAADDLVRWHPHRAYYWYLRGRTYSEGSRFDAGLRSEAEASLKRADQLSPNRQQIIYAQGRHFLIWKEYDGALPMMKRLVDLDPAVAESHWFYGTALVEAGDEARGADELVRAGELHYNPQTLDEALFLRELFIGRGLISLVADYSQAVVHLEPTAERFAEAAAAYAAIGENDLARANVKTAVELDPSLAEEAERFLSLLESGGLRTAATSTP